MTVGQVIVELEAEGGSLRFVSESPDNDWCSCWLLSSGGGQRRLGRGVGALRSLSLVERSWSAETVG